MLGTDHFCIYHSFSIRWSSYSFGCSSTCWNYYFLNQNDVTKYRSHVTPGCLISCPTLWELSGFVLSPITIFFGRLPTQVGICIAFNRHYFKYHVNMFSPMCGSKHLVINSSYHTSISSIFNLLPYNTTYLSCLATSYGCPFVIMSVWSCHWRFRYPFALVSLWGWSYINPRYISRYYCSYCLGK